MRVEAGFQGLVGRGCRCPGAVRGTGDVKLPSETFRKPENERESDRASMNARCDVGAAQP